MPPYCGIWVTCFTFFHGSFSIDVFFDSPLKLRLAKVNGQTALFYAALQVRVKQIRVRNGLWWFAGMLLRGSRYHVASVVVRSKGCVKQPTCRSLQGSVNS